MGGVWRVVVYEAFWLFGFLKAMEGFKSRIRDSFTIHWL